MRVQYVTRVTVVGMATSRTIDVSQVRNRVGIDEGHCPEEASKSEWRGVDLLTP